MVVRMFKFLMVPLFFSLMACASLRPEEHLLEFSGMLQQVTDLSDPITCYCEQAEYIDACGMLIPDCFDTMGSQEACVNVTVKGYYENFTPDRRIHSTCPETEQRILIITEIICRD